MHQNPMTQCMYFPLKDKHMQESKEVDQGLSDTKCSEGIAISCEEMSYRYRKEGIDVSENDKDMWHEQQFTFPGLLYHGLNPGETVL